MRPSSAYSRSSKKDRPPSAGYNSKGKKINELITEEDYYDLMNDGTKDKNLMIDKYFFNRSLHYKKK